MPALYNENAPFPAAWLKDLIAHDLVAQGRVDTRSIADLHAGDVAGPGQRHFFAGIGGWSRALRLAGVGDDADVWTGSCPCQPLSDAGARGGFRDARHLWPAWFALIEQCRPPVVFGEQVASKLGLEWLDLVFSDLDRCGYTVGAADLCAAGVGAPHLRQRLYFVAYADGEPGRLLLRQWQSRDPDAQAGWRGQGGGMGHASGHGAGQHRGELRGDEAQHAQRATHGDHPSVDTSAVGGMANADGRSGNERIHDQPQGPSDLGGTPKRARRERDASKGAPGGMADAPGQRGRRRGERETPRRQAVEPPRRSPRSNLADTGRAGRKGPDVSPPGRRVPVDCIRSGATRGYWADADWILCRDPSGGPPVARPVEPGTFPLAHGVPDRVGLLSGYGNAIVPQVAASFVVAALDALAGQFLGP